MKNSVYSPFHYSSGESVPASSDAQTVDYGLGFDHTVHIDASAPQKALHNRQQIWNDTPENLTSNFGSVAYPFFKPGKPKQKAVPVALKLAKDGPGRTVGATRGNVGGGGRSVTGFAVPDAVSHVGGANIDIQSESAISRGYIGQLGV